MSTERDDMSGGLADAESVAAIKGGDPRAWGDVFDRHRQAVWQVAISVVRHREGAEDVVQSTFLTAVESLAHLREPSRLRPWLLAIARRRALDVVRRSREIAFDPSDPSSPPFDRDLTAGVGDEIQ
jgi:RNA polymerase sigma-70 factor (ECF subfamily)